MEKFKILHRPEPAINKFPSEPQRRSMRYDFEWDPRKARTNFRKHNVSFESAATIFRDPNLLSIPDSEHSDSEERWITMGLDKSGRLLVVNHTFLEVNSEVWRFRIISARQATRQEAKRYEEGV